MSPVLREVSDEMMSGDEMDSAGESDVTSVNSDADWSEQSGVAASPQGRGTGRRERMLMRQWLEQQADNKTIENMMWFDAEHTMIRIPWKHGSRSGWTLDDCHLYKAWAIHTGKYSASHEEPKRWKANFRCALNSLPDVREIKHLGQTRGKDPFKVYQFVSSHTARRPAAHKKSRRSGRRPERANKLSSSSSSSSSQQQHRSRVTQQQPRVQIDWPAAEADDDAGEFDEQLPALELPEYFTSFSALEPITVHMPADCYPATSGGVIPTMVEELSNDDSLFQLESVGHLATTTSSLSFSSTDACSISYQSLSPVPSCSSSQWSTESFESEQDLLDDIDSVIPSWCKTNEDSWRLLPTSVTDDDFVQIGRYIQ